MRHIVSFTYTPDNLPDSIAAGTDRSIAFCYTSSGRKVRETTRSTHYVPHPLLPEPGNLKPDTTLNSPFLVFVDKRCYCDNMVYSFSTRSSRVLIDGGYISFGVGGTPVYHFYQRDHLGNVRVVSDASGTVEEVNHYYPYGALMGESQNTTTQPYKYNGKELDRSFGLDWYDYGARWMDGVGGRWSSMDPLCEKYYSVSPYAYCAGNPVNRIDPDGRSIYMLFYTNGNNRGDEMFRTAAETRKYDIEHSKFFNASNDIVILSPIQDLANIGKLVGNIVNTYSEIFGKTVEFSIWSHAGLDGPTGTLPTSENGVDGKQMSIDGWGSINFNWEQKANANFYGCKTGVGSANTPSFTTRVSAKANFHNVTVHGQSSSAYPSVYVNVLKNTSEMMNGNFSYPTYMVGGKSLGVMGRLFSTFSPANPMRSSKNGKGRIKNYSVW